MMLIPPANQPKVTWLHILEPQEMIKVKVGLKVIKVKVGLAEGTLQGWKRAWSEASFGMEACFPLQGGGSAITCQSKP